MKKKKIILVIDDDPFFSLFLKITLEDSNFQVVKVLLPVKETIEIIKNLNPVLIILDVNLNMNEDGIDFGMFLLEYNKIPYIYVTEAFDLITINRINKTRPYGYFSKPFKSEDFIININIILNNYSHRNVNAKQKIFEDCNSKNDVPFIIQKTIKYINENIYDLIEIDQLVSLTHWDKFHFLRMFTKHTGFTPYQYILQQKMNIAMGYLKETDMKIADIAYDLGFNSHSNFSVRFRKIVGVGPDEFRNFNQENKWLNNEMYSSPIKKLIPMWQNETS